MESPYNVTDELADMLLPGAEDRVKFHINQVEMTKAKYLDQMAAAYLLEVGVPVSQIELVQQDLPWPQIGWRFFYRLRE